MCSHQSWPSLVNNSAHLRSVLLHLASDHTWLLLYVQSLEWRQAANTWQTVCFALMLCQVGSFSLCKLRGGLWWVVKISCYVFSVILLKKCQNLIAHVHNPSDLATGVALHVAATHCRCEPGQLCTCCRHLQVARSAGVCWFTGTILTTSKILCLYLHWQATCKAVHTSHVHIL